MIRDELYSFVRIWNAHSIRPQKNRPNSVSGKPYMLYNYPGKDIQNWGVSFNKEQFRTLKDRVKQWDIDAVLPPETYQWCQIFLQSIQFDSSANIGDRTKPFLSFYLQLRNAIKAHVRSQMSPKLSLLASPTGAYNWQGAVSEQEYQDPNVRDADLETDPCM